MKIAVVAPSPVPFRIGGIENLVWSICDYINKETKHSADLIKLPSRELDFWSLIDTYKSFYDLDLSHFDAVITSKYPCWMIRHDNLVVYMAHRLRGLYDTYFMCNIPFETDRNCVYVNQILDYMDENPAPKSLDKFFELVYGLKDLKVPDSYYAFPGPFIRALVMYMDNFGMSYCGRKNFFSISDTVKARTEYFPEGANVKTLYPESEKKDTTVGKYEHVFMISRLDEAKRLDLLVKAMKYVKSDIKLKIAGTGPCEAKLKELAGDDKRIEFLGFVSDKEATDLYANALVIPYFPYDEDYGYITCEAMMHSKPVITTKDAGGPTEFTVDNETGFVVDTDPEAIAKAIDYFAENPAEAERMGKNAYEKVKDISWKNVVDELTAELEGEGKRKKITVPVTFGVYPAQGGGQTRLLELYLSVADTYDVEFVTNNIDLDTLKEKVKIKTGLSEVKIKISDALRDKMDIYERELGCPTGDIVNVLDHELNPEYTKAFIESAKTADVIAFSHPHLYNVYKASGVNKPFIYEAQDVEYKIKKEMYKDGETATRLLEALFEAEKNCCLESQFIITCSEKDKADLAELYSVDPAKILVVPNGVDTNDVPFTSIDSRIRKQNAMNLSVKKIGIFMGSYHKPNLEACDHIIKIAPECKDTAFLLMGSQCYYYTEKVLPKNVGLLGFADDDVKQKLFETCDFAVNPMFSGSGTNLKMFDYMSAGIPIITTEFGTRGIDDKSCFIIAEKDQMAEVINNFKLEDQRERVNKARTQAEEIFDWKVIAKAYISRIEEVIGK